MTELVVATIYVLTALSVLEKPSRYPAKRALKAVLWPWFFLRAIARNLASKAWEG